jgi:hypothetical protein
MAPVMEQLPAVGPKSTSTVARPALIDDCPLPVATVLKVALAPPVVDKTLQLTVFSVPPVIWTLICLVEPGNTWNGYVAKFGVMTTCADPKAANKKKTVQIANDNDFNENRTHSGRNWAFDTVITLLQFCCLYEQYGSP